MAPRGSQTLDLPGKALRIYESQPRMAFELVHGAILEGPLHGLVGGIWGDEVATALEIERSLQAVHLDLAADAFGSLPPL